MSKRRDTQQSNSLDSFSDRSLASLIRALDTHAQAPLTCAECRAHLAELYHQTSVGRALSDDAQAVLAHLATCPDCAAEYAALQTAMAAFDEGTLPELDQPHPFDLSFLTPPATAKAPPLWAKQMAEQLWRLVAELQVQLEAGRAAFVAFPAALTPTTAGAAMRAEHELEVLVLPAADAEFSIHLAVGPVIAGNAVVIVKLVDVEQARPLSSILVTLRNSQRQLLIGAMSGEDGSVVFEALPRGRYFVQVRFNQQMWEVPLMIMEGSPPM